MPSWEQYVNTPDEDRAMFFTFPDDARWNSERQTVEFGIRVGEYEGVVSVGRRVFQRLVHGQVTPERCAEAFHRHRTQFERIAERKLRQRRLTDDGNVVIDGRDLRERDADRQRPGPAEGLRLG